MAAARHVRTPFWYLRAGRTAGWRGYAPTDSSGGVATAARRGRSHTATVAEGRPRSSWLFRQHGGVERSLSPCFSGVGRNSCEARTHPFRFLRREGDSVEMRPLSPFSFGGRVIVASLSNSQSYPPAAGCRWRGGGGVSLARRDCAPPGSSGGGATAARRGRSPSLPPGAARCDCSLPALPAATLPLLFSQLGGGGVVRT